MKFKNQHVIWGTSLEDRGGIIGEGWKMNSALRKLLTLTTHHNHQSWVYPDQVHGIRVTRVEFQQTGLIPNTDGLVTNDPRVALLVKHADCLPIFLVDRKKHHIGLVHSGWRGTAAGIVVNGITALVKMGSLVEDIHVQIGPGARACCYRSVGMPIQFNEAGWNSNISKHESGYSIDLVGYIIDQLKKNGIKTGHIEDSRICTICNLKYHSWTRQKRDGKALKCGVSYIALR